MLDPRPIARSASKTCEAILILLDGLSLEPDNVNGCKVTALSYLFESLSIQMRKLYHWEKSDSLRHVARLSENDRESTAKIKPFLKRCQRGLDKQATSRRLLYSYSIPELSCKWIAEALRTKAAYSVANSPSRQLFPGYRLHKSKAPTRHWFGGKNPTKAVCPNCKKVLIQYFSVDLASLEPAIDLKIHRVPILYCMRCALCWYSFSYRCLDEKRIEIIEWNPGEIDWDLWYGDDGPNCDEFPKTFARLEPAPPRLQTLWDKLNDVFDVTIDEREEVRELTGNSSWLDDQMNQLGGRGFLIQGLEDPRCPTCTKQDREERMHFLICLTDDEAEGIDLGLENDYQVIAFFCPKCQTVTIMHSAS